ncbi:MAG: tRNA lysidine(34) synthetase TilS, partial [Lentisphaeria bacterium]|nr:tRNA lysidine(34) synthetase TilS [Lentisphaeria bacterium]
GLRGNASTGDARWCADFCREYNIPFQLVELELLQRDRNGLSLEDMAREARLEWYRKNDNGSPVVLAHHAGDVDENILLKLARGGNVSALTSLRGCRKLWNLTVLRPLLEWRKEELEDFLRESNVRQWRHDQSNDVNDYHRNYLRNELLKNWCSYHPPVRNGLQAARLALESDADFIEQCAAEKLALLGETFPETTQKNFWVNLHNALLARVLRGYIVNVSGEADIQITRKQICAFQDFIRQPAGSRVRVWAMNKNYGFRLKNDLLTFSRFSAQTAEPTEPALWNYRQETTFEYCSWQLTAELLAGSVCTPGKGVFFFDADKMPPQLVCDLRRGGEVMSVWGSPVPRRVKHILYGVENKDSMLLLRDENNAVYVLGDLRRSALAEVNENTKNTLKISVKR